MNTVTETEEFILQRRIERMKYEGKSWGEIFYENWNCAYDQSKYLEVFSPRIEFPGGVRARIIPNYKYNLLIRTADFQCGERSKQITIPWTMIDSFEIEGWERLKIVVSDPPVPGKEALTLFFDTATELMRFMAAVTSIHFLASHVYADSVVINHFEEARIGLKYLKDDGLFEKFRYQVMEELPEEYRNNSPPDVYLRGNLFAIPNVPNFHGHAFPRSEDTPKPRLFEYPPPFGVLSQKDPADQRGDLYKAQRIQHNPRQMMPTDGWGPLPDDTVDWEAYQKELENSPAAQEEQLRKRHAKIPALKPDLRDCIPIPKLYQAPDSVTGSKLCADGTVYPRDYRPPLLQIRRANDNVRYAQRPPTHYEQPGNYPVSSSTMNNDNENANASAWQSTYSGNNPGGSRQSSYGSNTGNRQSSRYNSNAGNEQSRFNSNAGGGGGRGTGNAARRGRGSRGSSSQANRGRGRGGRGNNHQNQRRSNY